MIKKISRNLFPGLIALTALSVSVSAAFYSVSGLSKLFAGASFEVIVMAGSLEVAKLVIASLLYQYWSTLNKLLRAYLTIAAVVLVLITSMGIYGFLSAAYQDTYRQLTIKENQTAFLTQKKDFYEKDVVRYDQELERISNNIATLSNAKAASIQVRDTSSSTGFRQTISTTELRLSQQRIEVEEENRASVQAKREIAADSLQKYQLAILDLENNIEVAGELGPLQYLSGLTGTPMDKIINILLLIIIFVFDPLAISLVVAANFAFDQANRKNLYNEYEDEIEPDLWDDIEVDTEEVKVDPLDNYNEDDERRMNIIGQNGNEGEHYDEARETVPKTIKEMTNKEIKNATKEAVEDWKVVDEQNKEIKEKKTVKRILQKGPSKNRVQFDDGSTGHVNKDDTTIHYL